MDVYLAIKSFIGNRSIERQNPLIPLWKKWYKEKIHHFINIGFTTEAVNISLLKRKVSAWEKLFAKIGRIFS